MRLITAADILAFYNDGSADLLVLADGKFTGLDYDDITGRATAYSLVTTEAGEEVQILLERTTVSDREWFPDALTDSGDLAPDVAAEMAGIINNDAGLHIATAVAEARQATEAWKASAAETNRLAAHRAARVARVAELAGSQSQAARSLGLDQSTVNKLVRKHAAQ
jgi:hypothetical protein